MLRIAGHERLLRAVRRLAPHRDVAAAVMVVVDGREHALRREERRLAMGELLDGPRERERDLAYARDQVRSGRHAHIIIWSAVAALQNA